MKNSNRVLKPVLGKKRFKELCLYTKKRVKEEFWDKGYFERKRLISINNSAVLIIGLGKARKYKDFVIKEFLSFDILVSEDNLIEDDYEKFIKEYESFIDDIVRHMQNLSKK